MSQTYPEIPLGGWQENPIEGTAGVRAVTGVKELKDASPALSIVSSATDFKFREWKKWKSRLKSPGAGSVIKVTHVHFPPVSRVKAWVTDGSICTLNRKIT